MARASRSYLNKGLYEGEGMLDNRDIQRDLREGRVFKANLWKPVRYEYILMDLLRIQADDYVSSHPSPEVLLAWLDKNRDDS